MTVSSIFNDVIGPVMRGPSSSHSAAGCRLGLLLRDLIDGDIQSFTVDYDPNGSLVTTHESQGTDMGLYGGLLGWQAHDERMEAYQDGIREAGIDITSNIGTLTLADAAFDLSAYVDGLLITCDAQGKDDAGSLVETYGSLAQALLLESPLITSADLDLTTFAAFDTTCPHGAVTFRISRLREPNE